MNPHFSDFVINFARHIHAKSYLELGLDQCATIIALKEKIPDCVCVGVDLVIHEKEANFEYFEGSINDFFDRNMRKFDLIFIDASHEYYQTLGDLSNALLYLNEGGVILMHDTDPAKPELFSETRCGNCYLVNKMLPHMGINFVTLPIGDEGMTIITKKENQRAKSMYN